MFRSGGNMQLVKQLMGLVFILGLNSSGLAAKVSEQSAPATNGHGAKPNIILVVMDNFGYGEIGV